MATCRVTQGQPRTSGLPQLNRVCSYICCRSLSLAAGSGTGGAGDVNPAAASAGRHVDGTGCPPPAICGAGMGQDASCLARRCVLNKEGLLAEPACGMSMYRTVARDRFPGQICASRGAEQSCWDTTAAIGLPPCSQPLPQAAGGRGAGAALCSARASLLPCKWAAKGEWALGRGYLLCFHTCCAGGGTEPLNAPLAHGTGAGGAAPRAPVLPLPSRAPGKLLPAKISFTPECLSFTGQPLLPSSGAPSF